MDLIRDSVRAQLATGFGIVLCPVGHVGFLGLRAIQPSEQDTGVKAAVQLGAAQSALWQLRYDFPQVMVDASGQADIMAAEADLVAAVEENLDAYRAGDRTAAEKEALAAWDEVWGDHVGARPTWFELYGADDIAGAPEWRAATTTPWGARAVESISDMIRYRDEAASQRSAVAVQAAADRRRVLLALLGLSLAAGVGAGALVHRALNSRLSRVSVTSNAFAQGDLTKRVDVAGDDVVARIAADVNAAMEIMQEVLGSVAESSCRWPPGPPSSQPPQARSRPPRRRPARSPAW